MSAEAETNQPIASLEEVLQSGHSRREWLNQMFLQVAECPYPDNPDYIVAPEFNLEIRWDILKVAAVDISEFLRGAVKDIDSKTVIYGIPAAGDRVASVVAQYLQLTTGVSRKGNDIPGSWNDVLHVETHSYTTTEKKVPIHFSSVKKGMPVILIDDVLATGKTLFDCIKGFEKAGVEVSGVGVMFSKAFEGGLDKIQNELGIPVASPVIIEKSPNQGKLSSSDLVYFNGNKNRINPRLSDNIKTTFLNDSYH